MDHRFIDEHSVADRYLDHKLPKQMRAAFEAHVVDCQECADRLLLAEMFHARNSLVPGELARPLPQTPPARADQGLPLRARFVAQFRPWQLVVLFAVTALLLLALPTAYFFWEISRLTTQR